MNDFNATRSRFDLPEDLVYLDGNSLGPVPRDAAAAVARVVTDEWGELLVRGWNDADWMGSSTRIGDRIGRLIGAPEGTVIVGDTLSLKVYQALAAALALRPGRNVVVSDSGNFPSDLYMADGLFRTMGGAHELRIVDPDAVADAIDESVAVVLLTEVDYRTGRRHDMAALTAAAHAAGALTVWDLAHSAGALDVDLAGCDADFAVGCTYKYLNGGPGSPGFIFVSESLIEEVRPALSGWLGHEAPFAFDLDFRPDPGIGRMRVGTPPVLALAALDVALDAWEGVDMADVRARSIELSERLIAGVEASCPTLDLASPRNPDNRGSQVAFRHPEGYAVMQALIARGVIGDFRAPDLIRFGITPLYLDEADIDRAVEILIEIMATDAWDTPEYRMRKAVT